MQNDSNAFLAMSIVFFAFGHPIAGWICLAISVLVTDWKKK